MKDFTKKSATGECATVMEPEEKAKLVEMEESNVKVKVAAVVQTTRDQMAKFMGRRQDRPSTADQTVGKGASASYGGYSKRE
jgi:type II secretory pathway component HofQ